MYLDKDEAQVKSGSQLKEKRIDHSSSVCTSISLEDFIANKIPTFLIMYT